MIVADGFPERTRSVAFAAGDHPPFLGVVVAWVGRIAQSIRDARILDRVIDFVPQAQRRRLAAAVRGVQRAVWIPCDFVVVGIEVIVVAIVDGQPVLAIVG